MRPSTIATFAAGFAVGSVMTGVLTLGLGAAVPSEVSVRTTPVTVTTVALAEDEPAWDCVTMGNRVCGPTNATAAQPGCYDDGGALVAPWPCHVEVNPDGSADVFTGTITVLR